MTEKQLQTIRCLTNVCNYSSFPNEYRLACTFHGSSALEYGGTYYEMANFNELKALFGDTKGFFFFGRVLGPTGAIFYADEVSNDDAWRLINVLGKAERTTYGNQCLNIYYANTLRQIDTYEALGNCLLRFLRENHMQIAEDISSSDVLEKLYDSGDDGKLFWEERGPYISVDYNVFENRLLALNGLLVPAEPVEMAI